MGFVPTRQWIMAAGEQDPFMSMTSPLSPRCTDNFVKYIKLSHSKLWVLHTRNLFRYVTYIYPWYEIELGWEPVLQLASFRNSRTSPPELPKFLQLPLLLWKALQLSGAIGQTETWSLGAPMQVADRRLTVPEKIIYSDIPISRWH